MDIEIIFKIAGIGLVITFLNSILSKAGKDEYVMLTTLAGIIIVSVMLIEYIEKMFSLLRKLFEL